jgi:hypothetical protein
MNAERWEIDASILRGEIQQLTINTDDATLKSIKSKLDMLKSSLLILENSDNRTKTFTEISRLFQPYTLVLQREDHPVEYILEEQTQVMREQDKMLDPISRNITQLLGMGTEIGNTADLQTRLISEIDVEADDVEARVRLDTRKSREVERSSDTRFLHCVIFALVATFIIMLLIKV